MSRTYWQSFEHLANSDEVRELLDKEFPSYDPEEIRSLPRRSFLKYIAASMALAGIGLAGCRRYPRQYLAPYAHQPENRVPGVPEYYATSWEVGGVGVGLLAASYDGRPIKLEGNPQHSAVRTRSGQWGAADQIAQAQTLSLYDPDRSRHVIERQQRVPIPRTRPFREIFADYFQQRRGDGSRIAVLSEATSSPTMRRLREAFEEAFPGAGWYVHEPVDSSPQRQATQAALGQPLRTYYRLDRADVVVSLDDDYLGLHPAHVRYAADWSVGRARVDEDRPRMSRCYAAECRYSLTGASGDVRLPVRPSRLPLVAQALAASLGVQGAQAQQELSTEERQFVEAAAADLREAGPAGLVAFGHHLPPGLQVLAMQINQAIGAIGQTLLFLPDPTIPGENIADLTRRMQGGEIETLIILGGNPAYDAPADVPFADALANVPVSIHLSLYDDETSALCAWHVPRAHFLEHWGDTVGWDGTIAPIQPLILPLFDGLSPIELIAFACGLEQQAGYDLVRETFQPALGNDTAGFDVAFRRLLHDGVLPGSTVEPVEVAQISAAGDLPMMPAGEQGTLEVTFQPDSKLWDGRFANNGWLQECPDPMTTLTWDNAALMSVADAEERGIRTRDVIRLTLDGRTLELPVYVQAGQPRGVIGLVLGYGRTRGGQIGSFQPGHGGGFQTFRLRTSTAPYYAAGAQVERQGQRYYLGMVQNHHLIDDVGFAGRDRRIGEKGQPGLTFRESSFAQHIDHLAAARERGYRKPHPANYSPDIHAPVHLQIFNPPHRFNNPHAWGMAIDTTACIGCGACVVACQAENNVPVVGKQMVLNNREMHWLRVDRYFKSEGRDVAEKKRDPNPEVAFQPMMCVHCENAPCEQVCPVAATVHDTEGLNTMVYNRCIGTRYCSNNCPYKVRRFNYLDYHYKHPRGGVPAAMNLAMPDLQQERIDPLARMVHNPDVTVRMRGIMEKCTYCTQRIKAKTIWRRNRGESIQDGDILTACQMACPTEAIIFGNLLDPEARVTRLHKTERAYELLGELNTRPRTRYLARLRNRPPTPADATQATDTASATSPDAVAEATDQPGTRQGRARDTQHA